MLRDSSSLISKKNPSTSHADAPHLWQDAKISLLPPPISTLLMNPLHGIACVIIF